MLFRYFQLLDPVLGDDSLYADVDGAGSDGTMQPLLDKDPDMCMFLCHQISFN